MKTLALVLNDIRSLYNVGSIFRTADASSTAKLYLCGYTPYPEISGDKRKAHIRIGAAEGIAKTALGAEKSVPFKYFESIKDAITELKHDGYTIYALEINKKAQNIFTFTPPTKTAIILGNEVDGIPPKILKLADGILEIPMFGKKESLNVSVAAGVAAFIVRQKQAQKP